MRFNRMFKLMRLILSGLILNSHFIFPSHDDHLYKFEKVYFSDGLPQVSVRSMLQNRQGFLWFATSGGLVKYDGYRTKVYAYIPGNPNSLGNNDISTIHEDRRGLIWIGLVGGGLDCFDPVSERFVHFRRIPKMTGSLLSNYVFAINEDKTGDLWVGLYLGGFSRLQVERDEENKITAKFTNYWHIPENPQSISSNTVLAICPDRFGNIWCGTDNGLNKFDPRTETFTRFLSNPADSQSLSSNRVTCIYEDRSGVLWIGTRYGGLNRMENRKNPDIKAKFKQYRISPHNSSSLSSDFVMCIFEDSKNNLWIGTVGGGLNILDKKIDKFMSFKNNPFNTHSLSGNQVLSLCEDKTGNLWIGLGLGSVNKLNINSCHFLNLKLNTPTDIRDMNNSFFSLYVDQGGILWAGNEYGYLCKFELDKGLNSDDYIRNPKSKKFLKIYNDRITVVYRDKKRDLWIGTSGQGLFHIPPENLVTGRHINYRFDPNDRHSLRSNEITSIHEDRRGNIWIGTSEQGISILTPENRAKRKFLHHRCDPDNPYSLSHSYVRKIYEDRRGNIWIGTDSGGLNKYDHEDNKFVRYTHRNDDPTSISCNCIMSILEDSSGILWIGTGYAGLNKFDHKHGIFKSYTKNDGLPDNKIYGILEDNKKNLWLSTNKGLSKFSPTSEIFVNFNEKDGLQDNEFNTGAYCKSSTTGQLYFGGINGITTFSPDRIKQNTYIPPIQITSFTVLNKKFGSGQIKADSKVNLSYKAYIFSFEFVALDYTDPKLNKYAYKLEGFKNDWIYTDWSNRIATFTNIPPGSYIFRVKGSNNHGVWNEPGISIFIEITPPFWKTWWFKVLVIMFIALFIIAVQKKRMQNFKIQLKTENEINNIYSKHKITTREMEIIDLLKKRKTYKQIEDELYISYHTVKNHIHNIFKKLGVTNRAELIYYFKSIGDEFRRDGNPGIK